MIVGYGLTGFDHSDCADDVQVSANLLGNPGTFDIDGDGATFVFGADGNLVVDNSTTITGLSVRFNQRYAEVDRGGRVSIMSVNGDDVTAIDHIVDDVVSVPRSRVMVDETTVALGENGATYTVSSPRFTSKARLPEAPADLTLTPFKTPTGAAGQRRRVRHLGGGHRPGRRRRRHRRVPRHLRQRPHRGVRRRPRSSPRRPARSAAWSPGSTRARTPPSYVPGAQQRRLVARGIRRGAADDDLAADGGTRRPDGRSRSRRTTRPPPWRWTPAVDHGAPSPRTR